MPKDRDDLLLSGAFSEGILEEITLVPLPLLVEGLVAQKSVNILVGDSGLGKTPLMVQMGLSVASGLPFCGRPTVQGDVLYIDCESDPGTFRIMLQAQRGHLGIPFPLDNFLVYSHNWDPRPDRPAEVLLAVHQAIERFRPALVFIDPLRMVWPKAEMKSEDTVIMIGQQRAMASQFGCAFMNIHHCRKPNQENPHPVSLVADPHAWLLEAAGSRALVNQTDTRLGVIQGDDLLVAGFTRITGPIPAFTLRRIVDDVYGDPIAYEMVSGVTTLSGPHQDFFNLLPQQFKYNQGKLIHTSTRTSASASEYKRAVKAMETAGVLVRLPGKLGYAKVISPLVPIA